jgi:hypothetical protein
MNEARENEVNWLPAPIKPAPKPVRKAPDKRLNKKQWRGYWRAKVTELHLEDKARKQNQNH